MSHDTSPIRVIVGSRNPVKIGAVHNALAPLFPGRLVRCEGMHAPSGVPDQPMTAAETREGALNRMNFCRQHAEADFHVALEGGVDVTQDGPGTFGYVAIAHGSDVSVGCSAWLPLPLAVYEALLEGDELGDVMDRLFGTVNIKQQGGAIGLVTNGHATRESAYTQAMVLAMAPFLHPELYGLDSSAT
ncbi:inosine/xanthosine triphosphatase [Luteibacter sp. UNC138MFCol5.1]|uniref:inosine/xanthosine triphosphatase n=1 Tax=Luteibacter sp. UNC138MFCol5.1 TaxID=1502774 RepID=UPI0008BF8784|nr:inosine/xanthosine triphosphatase [Luteibacter sp. UNC138MFCol5.1]SEO92642.1 inosine/xanthosine triphosphatase [Luteibacter sp. UNC138MFCol5.1]